MPSRQEFLEAIETELEACDRANPPNAADEFRQILECNALKRHRDWVRESIDNQNILQQIADSLEKNLAQVRQQGWVEICCTD